ncbi:unnamed protein product [Moneuplotes crassus]|uniref:Uncharacterized protein n=1 Tax=Euplotes crassus TaxID=5936 RepID=A0AAD1XR01_EUPCR|nr:unnamed protein product [Moneuplotes crassus]
MEKNYSLDQKVEGMAKEKDEGVSMMSRGKASSPENIDSNLDNDLETIDIEFIDDKKKIDTQNSAYLFKAIPICSSFEENKSTPTLAYEFETKICKAVGQSMFNCSAIPDSDRNELDALVCDVQKGNNEKVLVNEGYCFSKTWRVCNIGLKSWPKLTKLICTFPGLKYKNISLTSPISKNKIVDITVVFEVPNPGPYASMKDPENPILTLNFNLITPTDYIIGPPLILYLHYNEEFFTAILNADHDPRKFLFLTKINTVCNLNRMLKLD